MSIQLETDIRSDLTSLDEALKDQFTFPCDSRIDRNLIKNKVISVKAKDGNKVIGLGLASYDLRKKESEILSIVIDPAFRGKRIATQILKSLVANLEEKGFRKVTLVYQSDWSSYHFMGSHLTAHGWIGPEELSKVFIVDISERHDEVMALELPVPSIVQVETWENQGEARLTRLKEYLGSHPDLPNSLNPFRDEKLIAPKCSMVAIDKDKIIGWNMAYKRSENSREFSNLYIDKEYRSRGLVWSLFISSIRMQSSLNIPINIGIVSIEFSPILDYYIRRISNNKFISHSHYLFTRNL